MVVTGPVVAAVAARVACGDLVVLVHRVRAGRMVLVAARLSGLILHLGARRRALHGKGQPTPDG